MSRQLASVVYNSLKAAWVQQRIRLGSTEAMAACIGRVPSMVSAYGNPSDERFPPIDVVLDADAVAGEPTLTEALARAQGYRLKRVHAGSQENPNEAIAQLAERSGALTAASLRALADSVVTAEERAELRRHLFVLMREAAEAMAALEQADKPAETTARAAHEAGRASVSSPTVARRAVPSRRADFVGAGS